MEEGASPSCGFQSLTCNFLRYALRGRWVDQSEQTCSNTMQTTRPQSSLPFRKHVSLWRIHWWYPLPQHPLPLSLSFVSPSLFLSPLTLHAEEGEWSEVKVKKGESPSPRHSHTAVVWKNSLFIFGGALEKGALDNTLYSFNFGTVTPLPSFNLWHAYFDFSRAACDLILSVQRTWKKVSVKGTPPSGRWGHSAVVFGSSMFIFGGFSESSSSNQLFQFDFGTFPSLSFPVVGKTHSRQQSIREESMERNHIRECSIKPSSSFRGDLQTLHVCFRRIFNFQLFWSSPFWFWYVHSLRLLTSSV